MASITDWVVEGLKYPFNDLKKLLNFGVLFALISALSTYIGIKSFEIFIDIMHIAIMVNVTVSHITLSQLPVDDIKFVVGLTIVSFIISLLVMGYQYDTIKLSIDRKKDLPGSYDIIAMFAKGIKYFIVTLAYNIIPTLVLVVGIALAGESLILPIIFISMLLFIIAYFLLIMALNNMVAYDSIKKAFDFREIIDNISNLGWARYVGIILFTIIVVMIIAVAAGILLSFISVLFAASINNQAVVISMVIAIIEGLFINSYISLFFNRVCGSIYRESIK